jgi:hypothetical protein
LIDRATKKDIPKLVELGMKFTVSADLPVATEHQLEDFFFGIIGNADAVAFVSKNGAIVGFVAPLFYRPDYMQAHEVMWFAEDRQGLKLLEAFENWAETKNANEIQMNSLVDFSRPAVNRALKLRGYTVQSCGLKKDLK